MLSVRKRMVEKMLGIIVMIVIRNQDYVQPHALNSIIHNWSIETLKRLELSKQLYLIYLYIFYFLMKNLKNVPAAQVFWHNIPFAAFDFFR